MKSGWPLWTSGFSTTEKDFRPFITEPAPVLILRDKQTQRPSQMEEGKNTNNKIQYKIFFGLDSFMWL